MALFDRASLVQIPSGYKEGKLYNIKPFDQPFEFERGSAATRVNEDGLIEYVGIGEELVTDGGFDDASAWTTSGGASVSGGVGNFPTAFSQINQTGIDFVNGETYLITFDIKSTSSNIAWFTQTTSIKGYTNYTEGSHTLIYNSTNDTSGLIIYSSGTASVIDNVSIKDISNDTPRIDYTNGKALLLEPQRTNEYLNSNDFSLWNTDVSATDTANQLDSPDGNINATLMSVTNSGRIYYDPTISTTADRVFSIFIKGGTFNHFRVGLIGSVALVDLINETSSIGDINSIGNGWYRVSLPPTSVSSTSRRAQIQAYPDNTYTNSHGQSGTYYIYGSQLEQGSYATSYIPTNGQAETRLADVCQGGGDESTFNDSEGVLYAEIAALANDGTSRKIAIGSGSSVTVIGVQFTATNNEIGGFNLGSTNTTVSDVTEYNKIAINYESGSNYKVFINGSLAGSGSYTHPISSANELAFDDGAGTNPFYGKIKSLAYFPEALTDTELQQLTTI